MFLSNVGLLIAGIAIVIGLIVIFFVSYVFNKKTPVPKGCEQIAIDTLKCSGCADVTCEYHERANEILEKMREDLKEEKK